ncbi:N-acetylglucosamine-6-phosphate deacetylase [Haliea sp. E17]|uniref:N-acetylglucosamine-6-phosphate deacetylase n=1 Tax=Haliea sp. E17 TaxID=3401576 RepID=UPI003AAD0D95
MQLIENGRIFTGEQHLEGYSLLLENGRIAALLPRAQAQAITASRYDLQGGTLLPGFIDLQVNGGGGVLFNDSPDIGTLRIMGEAHRQFGTTGFLPTLISADLDTMRRAIAAVDEAIAQEVPGVLGIHLEGPLLNPDRRGIHDARWFRQLDEELFSLLTRQSPGCTLVTIAPECCRPEQIRRLAEHGVIVAAGHTGASYEQVCDAMDAGLTGFTHLFNAMSPLQSRAPGAVGAALAADRGWFGIIADGYHVHPAALRVAVRAREAGAALLVTDAMPTVGSDLTQFELGSESISLCDGRLLNPGGTLAGSHLDMLAAVNNAAAFAGIDWFEAARMASLYPARVLGLEDQLGRLAPGYRANLLALDSQGSPRASWVAGLQGDCVTEFAQ